MGVLKNRPESENEKLNKIKELLKDEYADMSDKEICAFASDLYFAVFKCKYGLEEILPIVDLYEERAEIKDTKWYYVYCGVVDLMDNNEETAEKLYNHFMFSMDMLNTFVKLYFENDKYISAEKLLKAKKKALKTFDKHVLEFYGITEEED